MSHMRNGFMFATALAGVLGASADSIFPTAQSRGTDVIAQLQGSEVSLTDTDTDTAGGFGPYSSNIDASVSIGDPNNPYTASSLATQSSSISGSAITGAGYADALGDPNGPDANPSGHGTSYIVVDFDIYVPQTYSLTGFIDATFVQDGLASAMVELVGPGGTEFSYLTPSGFVNLNSAGLLAPGAYTLTVVADAEALVKGDSASANFGFEMIFVPEPATVFLLMPTALALLRRREE